MDLIVRNLASYTITMTISDTKCMAGPAQGQKEIAGRGGELRLRVSRSNAASCKAAGFALQPGFIGGIQDKQRFALGERGGLKRSSSPRSYRSGGLLRDEDGAYIWEIRPAAGR